MLNRQTLTGAVTALVIAFVALAASAHHGWRWTADGNFALTGVIEEVELGNPHGMLTVNADGERWTVEVGQPWRHARIDLSDEEFRIGREIEVIGHRSADADELRVKAERVIFDGKTYVLYPDRD